MTAPPPVCPACHGTGDVHIHSTNTAPPPVCQHCCGTGKRPVTDYDRFKAEHPEELAKAEAELNAEMAPPAPVCHDGWHVGDGETCVCGSYKTPPAPDCAMCGHAAHERDCETKVLREQIPCGCQFWAEGWKLTAPPAPERMSEEERSVPLVYISVEATRENVEMHYPAPERMSDEEFEKLVTKLHPNWDEHNANPLCFLINEAERARESEEALRLVAADLKIELRLMTDDRDRVLASKEADLEACRANNRNATRMLNAKDAEVERLRRVIDNEPHGWRCKPFRNDRSLSNAIVIDGVVCKCLKGRIARAALEGKP